MTPPNALIHTASPYLLQHADNPIAWYPWCKEALEKAQQEDKPILLSIGYSACHWCHVMAKESFENEDVAAIMNQHFICIKVDREERPDIDQVYIEALQAMGIQAGWPLHVFLLPNQQPFYGGTYFPPVAWKQLLQNIIHAFQTHRNQLETSAGQFTQALQQPIIHVERTPKTKHLFNSSFIQSIFEQVYQQLDQQKGGMQGAPKFPMPSLHAFLLNYYRWKKDERALAQLKLTLQNMAYGGIYDQLAGGFARYATDENWIIPHFEKMLYDNAQLIGLYAQAHLTTHHPLYPKVINQSIHFMEKEMMHANGGFYSALDADSEGVEGKFYIWTQAEIEKILGQDASFMTSYYNTMQSGNWEKGYNILYKTADESNKTPKLHQQSIQGKLEKAKERLLKHRNQRPKPALDDKILTSWNGMMIKALIYAYYSLDHTDYLEQAKRSALFIHQKCIQGNQIWHSIRKKQLGPVGYLEDYAWIIRAWISLYQATFEEKWIYQAVDLTNHVNQHFWDEANQLFYFTTDQASELISRPQEIFDQVIPSSNAVMAHNLWTLGMLLAQETFIKQAESMLQNITPLLPQSPVYLTHWASLYIKQLQEIPTVSIIGPDCLLWAKVIKQKCPDALVLGTTTSSHLPLLADKQMMNDHSTIYICYGKTCQAPIQNIASALKQLSKLPDVVPT